MFILIKNFLSINQKYYCSSYLKLKFFAKNLTLIIFKKGQYLNLKFSAKLNLQSFKICVKIKKFRYVKAQNVYLKISLQ